MSARPVGRTLALPLLVATLLAVAVPGAAAGPVLPVGEAQGVRIKRERGALVVVFTREAAPLYRLVAGKVVRVICTDLRADDGIRLGVTESASGGGGVRASKRRRPLRTGDLTRGLDYCRVWLAERTVRRRRVHRVYGERLIVSVPLTQAGAVHLDEEAKAWTLWGVLFSGLAQDTPGGSERFRTPAELVDAFEALEPSIGFNAIPLASPVDTPPAGSVGYWSDGERHAASVTVSASGRRLFLEVADDEVLHTNVARYIYGNREVQ